MELKLKGKIIYYRLKKTEKTISEMELEMNLNFELSKIMENGK